MAVRIDQVQVDIALVLVDRNRLVDLAADVLVGQSLRERAVDRTAVVVEMSSWILAVRRRADYIDHLEERYVHSLLVLVLMLCRIVMCYAAVKFDHIDLVVVVESCKSFGRVVELRILLRLGVVLEADIVKKVDVVQTVCSLQVVQCRCMSHSVPSRYIRSCCSAMKHGDLHRAYLRACHQDRQTSVAESSAVFDLADCEACFLRPISLMRAGLRDHHHHHHQSSVRTIHHVIAFRRRGDQKPVVQPSRLSLRKTACCCLQE